LLPLIPTLAFPCDLLYQLFSFFSTPLNFYPESISQLINLISFSPNYNQLSSLPESIGELTNLTELNLSNNQLNALPESIGKLTNLTKLIINENPLIHIPPEVIKKDGLAVLDYYRQRLEENTDYIYEAKLLIIGEGGAGKTSLANKLINSEYKLKTEGCDNQEHSTEGIDILRFDFPHSNGNLFRINIWDFGGQEIPTNSSSPNAPSICLLPILAKIILTLIIG
jgi:internalin A